jgi:hypothetical protein
MFVDLGVTGSTARLKYRKVPRILDPIALSTANEPDGWLLRSGSVGPYLSRFVSALERGQFSRDTIRRYIRGADSLCRWLDGQGIAVAEANQSHIERYVLQHARWPDRRRGWSCHLPQLQRRTACEMIDGFQRLGNPQSGNCISAIGRGS